MNRMTAKAIREGYYSEGDELKVNARPAYKDYEITNLMTGKMFVTTHLPDGHWTHQYELDEIERLRNGKEGERDE